MLHYKRAGVGRERLRDIYCAMTRSVLEYSSNVYHSQMNNRQNNELERIQKRCLRLIYGYDKDYKELLELSGLKTLKQRREEAFSKFANKTAKNPKYGHWFPLKEKRRHTRGGNTYKEETAVGNRLYNSPIYAMRRLLNNTESERTIDLSGIFNEP